MLNYVYCYSVARTYYTRTAFQIPGDSRHRLSLDTNFTMIKEDDHLFPDDPTSRRPNGEWRRPDVDVNFPFSELAPDDVRRFPYAILEIKLNLPSGSQPPAWIDELISSGLVEEAPKFSKFVHASAVLFERRVHLLPFWVSIHYCDYFSLLISITYASQCVALAGTNGIGRGGHIDRSRECRRYTRAIPKILAKID
jgi:SPX domain protein involved in polyphosphate accumulation